SDLARTLDLIAAQGSAAFYHGSIADRIEQAMRRDGGLLTRADLATYRPVVREPLVGSYRGYTLYTMPPPSSGGIILIGLLHALEPDSIAASATTRRRSSTASPRSATGTTPTGPPSWATRISRRPRWRGSPRTATPSGSEARSTRPATALPARSRTATARGSGS